MTSQHVGFLIFSFGAAAVCASVAMASSNAYYRLAWHDEFDCAIPSASGGSDDDGSQPNTTTTKWQVNGTTWAYEQGYIRNNEAQYYTTSIDNAWIEPMEASSTAAGTNCKLVIAALNNQTLPIVGGGVATITSASLYTKRSFRYGKIESRLKVPTGKNGTWPAFWLLGANINQNVSWPQCGEIDVMENVGFDPNVTHATIHDTRNNAWRQDDITNTLLVPEMAERFVVYGVEWTPWNLTFFADGATILTVLRPSPDSNPPFVAPQTCWTGSWPYDQDFQIKINFAIGGSWGGLNGIDQTLFPAHYEADYVRVYERVVNETDKNDSVAVAPVWTPPPCLSHSAALRIDVATVFNKPITAAQVRKTILKGTSEQTADKFLAPVHNELTKSLSAAFAMSLYFLRANVVVSSVSPVFYDRIVSTVDHPNNGMAATTNHTWHLFVNVSFNVTDSAATRDSATLNQWLRTTVLTNIEYATIDTCVSTGLNALFGTSADPYPVVSLRCSSAAFGTDNVSPLDNVSTVVLVAASIAAGGSAPQTQSVGWNSLPATPEVCGATGVDDDNATTTTSIDCQYGSHEFDFGGPHVAYMDVTAWNENTAAEGTPGAFAFPRAPLDWVDVGGGPVVGYTYTTEWLKFSLIADFPATTTRLLKSIGLTISYANGDSSNTALINVYAQVTNISVCNGTSASAAPPSPSSTEHHHQLLLLPEVLLGQVALGSTGGWSAFTNASLIVKDAFTIETLLMSSSSVLNSSSNSSRVANDSCQLQRSLLSLRLEFANGGGVIAQQYVTLTFGPRPASQIVNGSSGPWIPIVVAGVSLAVMLVIGVVCWSLRGKGWQLKGVNANESRTLLGGSARAVGSAPNISGAMQSSTHRGVSIIDSADLDKPPVLASGSTRLSQTSDRLPSEQRSETASQKQ